MNGILACTDFTLSIILIPSFAQTETPNWVDFAGKKELGNLLKATF